MFKKENHVLSFFVEIKNLCGPETREHLGLAIKQTVLGLIPLFGALHQQ